MNKKKFFLIAVASGILLTVGCAPTSESRYYRYSSSPVYDRYYSSPYYSGSYYDSYYDPYRSRRPVDRGLRREHAEQHERLDYKYDKAMNRLDRQEREAEAELYRKYDGNIFDPRYQAQQRKIDQKYDHKRTKVERNLSKEHREVHQDLGDAYND